jgi:hypothetical protein
MRYLVLLPRGLAQASCQELLTFVGEAGVSRQKKK